MARFLGFALFLVLGLGGILYMVARDAPRGDGETVVARDNIDIIASQHRAVDRVDDAVERTTRLADQMLEAASRLEKSAAEAEEAAENSLRLAETNEAADVSIAASYEAAERARITAAVARRVAGELKQASLDAEAATKEAGEVTRVAVEVEQSRKDAHDAAAEAREATAKLNAAEKAVENATEDASDFLASNGRTIDLSGNEYARRDDGSIIVYSEGDVYEFDDPEYLEDYPEFDGERG